MIFVLFSSPVYGGGAERALASEAEGADSAFAPLAASGSTPPVNGGRNIGPFFTKVSL